MYNCICKSTFDAFVQNVNYVIPVDYFKDLRRAI